MADSPANPNEPLQIYRSAPPDWLPKIHLHADLGQFHPVALWLSHLFTRLPSWTGFQVTMAFNPHDPAKKKTSSPSRTSRMGWLFLRPRSVTHLLGYCVDNVRLKGVKCYTGRDVECEGYDRQRVPRGCRGGAREYVFSDLQSP